MSGPMDAVLAYHNAFRRDMAGVDAAALAIARGEEGQEAAFERIHFLNEMLVWHADGEELAIFPALEAVAPLVAWSYERDHRFLDEAYETLNDAASAGDALQAARASAAFTFHLDVHLDKEDAHLYRLIRERVSLPDQNKALGMMASTVPPERSPEVIRWLFPLIENDDRETVIRLMQAAMPAPAFAGVSQLIHEAVGDDWAELVRRNPTLG